MQLCCISFMVVYDGLDWGYIREFNKGNNTKKPCFCLETRLFLK